MLSVFKPLRRLALTAGVVLLPLSSAMAQQVAPQIAVPTPTPGNQQSVEGCYSVNQYLYGPYHMNFCLNRWGGGSYQVTGGGLYCNGRVDWQRQWNGEVRINVQYTSCGRGVDWSADTMVCRASAPQWPPHQPNPGPWVQPQIAVPTPAPTPGNQSLNCTYYPGVGGYQPMSITARKTH